MNISCLYNGCTHRYIWYFVSMPKRVKVQIHSDLQLQDNDTICHCIRWIFFHCHTYFLCLIPIIKIDLDSAFVLWRVGSYNRTIIFRCWFIHLYSQITPVVSFHSTENWNVKFQLNGSWCVRSKGESRVFYLYEKMKGIKLQVIREKGWDLTKAPKPAEMSKGQSDNTNNATKKFDYTALADRLRTVSWSNYGHRTGVVNRFTCPTFSLPATAV